MLSKLPKITDKKAKRLGRGSGSRGDKSGRGTKRHQKAREKIPLHFEGGQAKITKKYPLLRGKGRNKSRSAKTIIIDLSDLNAYKVGEVVNNKTLVEKGIVDKKNEKANFKLLGNGKLEKKVKLEISASKSALKAVEKAGGSVSNK